MKNGFTLMELLVVIVIVSVISVGSVLAFGNIDDSTAIKDRKNIYKDIQRSAILYVDLDNTILNDFREIGQTHVKLISLIDAGYIKEDIEDPVTGDPISKDYWIKIYIAHDKIGVNGNEYIDTCILDNIEINTVYCNNDKRKCCNEDDKNNGRENCQEIVYKDDGTQETITLSADEEQKCMDDPESCNCYSVKLCNKKKCVANSYGEPYDCCSKE